MTSAVSTIHSEIASMCDIGPCTCSTRAAIPLPWETSSAVFVPSDPPPNESSDGDEHHVEQSKEIRIVVPGHAPPLSYPLSEDPVRNKTALWPVSLRSHLENLLLYWVITGCVLSWLAWNLNPQIHADMWAPRPRDG